jgi:dipeptidyl aminopeptidase/acylaminoacyl peptidase
MRKLIAFAALLFVATLAASQSPKRTVDYHKADVIRTAAAYLTGTMPRFGGMDWLEDSVRFWYKSPGKSDRNVVYLVDPRSASRRMLFDNARMAAAISVAADTILDPMRMPNFKVVENAAAIELPMFRKKPWRCELATYKCAALDSADYALKEQLKRGPSWATRSPDKKWDLFMYNYNIYVRPAALSDSEAVATRDSIKRAKADSAKKDTAKKAPAKPKSDTTPLPKGSTQLTTDGVRLQPYGAQPSEVKQEPIKPVGVFGARWSPDGRKIAVSRYHYVGVRVYPIYSSTSDQPIDHSYYWATPSDSINSTYDVHILDVGDKSNIKVKEPSSPDVNFGSDPTWNRTGDHLLMLSSSRGYKRIRLSWVDARTGEAKQVTQDSFATWVEGLPFETANGTDDIFVRSERDGWGHIYRFSPTNGLKQQLESGPYAVRSVLRVDSGAKHLYISATGKGGGNPYYSKVYRMGYDGAGMVELTPEDATHDVTFVPKAPYFIDSYSRPDLPPITVLRSTDNGRVVMELARGDVEYLRSVGWTPPEMIITKARDGVTDLWGLMYKPSDFDPSKVYPIIDHIYPGPQVGSVQNWGFAGTGEARALAELGFIVIEIDHFGTPRRSKAFHDFYFGNMGDNGIPDHITGIRQLAAKYPWIDINKVGIYGHSGGGFASTDAIFRYPDFYKVAVSGAGNHHPNNYGAFWADKYQGLYNKAKYDEAANYTHAKNLKGRLLLMHGDMDDNVHPSNTLKVVDALIKANKNTFDVIIFPDAGHGLPSYSIRKRWDYFVRYLMDAEPPENYEMISSP